MTINWFDQDPGESSASLELESLVEKQGQSQDWLMHICCIY